MILAETAPDLLLTVSSSATSLPTPKKDVLRLMHPRPFYLGPDDGQLHGCVQDAGAHEQPQAPPMHALSQMISVPLCRPPNHGRGDPHWHSAGQQQGSPLCRPARQLLKSIHVNLQNIAWYNYCHLAAITTSCNEVSITSLLLIFLWPMVVFPLTQRYSTLPSTISQALATQA